MLLAIALGLAAGFAGPALAGPPPEIQKLVRQGQYPLALEKIDAYLAETPGDAEARFLKGVVLSETGKPAEAIEIFTRLTEEYPEMPEPYNNLAVLYAQQKLYERARSALEMAVQAHPSYAIAWENLGDLYVKMAAQSYEKAAQLDPKSRTASSKLTLARDMLRVQGKPGTK